MSESEIIARRGAWSFELCHDHEVSSLGARAISKRQLFLQFKTNECAFKHWWGKLLLTVRYNFPKINQEKNATFGPRSPKSGSSVGLDRVTWVCIGQDTCPANESSYIYCSAINFVGTGQLTSLWIVAARMEFMQSGITASYFVAVWCQNWNSPLFTEWILFSNLFSLWNKELII